MGITHLANVYFRCREEQQNYCTPSDFHKPLANLPADTSLTYKNNRFGFTIVSVILTGLLPTLWQRRAGNQQPLNNFTSIPATLMWLLPVPASLLVINWALQAKNFFDKHLESGDSYSQQHLLSQMVLLFCVVPSLSLLIYPILVYKKIERTGGHVPTEMVRSNDGGVKDYWNYMRMNWRQQLMAASNPSQPQILLYGIGTSISAPMISIGTNLSLMTMIVLGNYVPN